MLASVMPNVSGLAEGKSEKWKNREIRVIRAEKVKRKASDALKDKG